jgi:pimeloyl-ACP methyl ester carboxylesterase
MAARLASPSSGSRRLSLTINGVAPLAAAAHKPSVSAVPLFYDRPCSPEANRLVNVPRMPSMDRATSPQRRASVSAPPVDDIPIADCILLLHGLMSDKREPVLAALAMALSEHYTCFMFDFPGQGGSEGEFEYGMIVFYELLPLVGVCVIYLTFRRLSKLCRRRRSRGALAHVFLSSASCLHHRSLNGR